MTALVFLAGFAAGALLVAWLAAERDEHRGARDGSTRVGRLLPTASSAPGGAFWPASTRRGSEGRAARRR